MARNGSSPGATCDSCGEADGPLQFVRRVFLETDEDGNLRRAQTAGGVEQWCPACRAVYPYEPVQG